MAPQRTAVRWEEGGRSLRICSFRGSYANRGNGMQQAFSDVVRRAGLEPANLPASDFETDSYTCSGICAYGTQRGRELKPLHTVLWWARLDLNQQCPSGAGFTVRCGTNYALLTHWGSLCEPSFAGRMGRGGDPKHSRRKAGTYGTGISEPCEGISDDGGGSRI